MISYLTNLFLTPDSYPNNPYEYARNQLGHSYIVGVALALFALGISWVAGMYEWPWAVFWLMMPIYIMWELGQIFFVKSATPMNLRWADAIMDAWFVSVGLLAVVLLLDNRPLEVITLQIVALAWLIKGMVVRWT